MRFHQIFMKPFAPPAELCEGLFRWTFPISHWPGIVFIISLRNLNGKRSSLKKRSFASMTPVLLQAFMISSSRVMLDERPRVMLGMLVVGMGAYWKYTYQKEVEDVQ